MNADPQPCAVYSIALYSLVKLPPLAPPPTNTTNYIPCLHIITNNTQKKMVMEHRVSERGRTSVLK